MWTWLDRIQGAQFVPKKELSFFPLLICCISRVFEMGRSEREIGLVEVLVDESRTGTTREVN